jgi:hypothetical protein
MGGRRSLTAGLALLAAFVIALGLIPSAPAGAADRAKPPGGQGVAGTAEIALPIQPTGGVGTADIIVCTVTVDGWYAGSGLNLASGIVICPTTVNSISVTFTWFRHNTGTVLRVAGKTPCLNKYNCPKSDGLNSYLVLDVYMCATIVKAGYTSGYGCAADDGF